MDQDATWYGGRPRPRRLCVRWGPSLLPKKGAEQPIFGPCLFWPNDRWIKMVLGTEVGLSPGDCVRLGPSPLPKRGLPSQFLAHFYCAQTAGCINIPLGMKVGLSPGDFVIDGTQPPPQNGAELPNFRLTSIVAKRLRGSRCHLVRR